MDTSPEFAPILRRMLAGKAEERPEPLEIATSVATKEDFAAAGFLPLLGTIIKKLHANEVLVDYGDRHDSVQCADLRPIPKFLLETLRADYKAIVQKHITPPMLVSLAAISMFDPRRNDLGFLDVFVEMPLKPGVNRDGKRVKDEEAYKKNLKTLQQQVCRKFSEMCSAVYASVSQKKQKAKTDADDAEKGEAGEEEVLSGWEEEPVPKRRKIRGGKYGEAVLKDFMAEFEGADDDDEKDAPPMEETEQEAIIRKQVLQYRHAVLKGKKSARDWWADNQGSFSLLAPAARACAAYHHG